MFEIFKSVIDKGDYDLEALLIKIDKYHIERKLSDQQRDMLYSMARNTPKASYNYAEEIEKLWAAIRELKGAEPEAAIKEFVQPTGAHDAYNIGDKVLFKGNIYTCLLANCVWSPETLPSAWELA